MVGRKTSLADKAVDRRRKLHEVGGAAGRAGLRLD
jgi:hypothetical protein